MPNSHFSWLAGFAADCPMCGAHMPANVRHECFPAPLDAPKPTLGKALHAFLSPPQSSIAPSDDGVDKASTPGKHALDNPQKPAIEPERVEGESDAG